MNALGELGGVCHVMAFHLGSGMYQKAALNTEEHRRKKHKNKMLLLS